MGALTTRQGMYSYRIWETKKDFIKDLLSSEALDLRVNIGSHIVQVRPKIADQYSFRWISDYTRYYYDVLNYKQKNNLGSNNISMLSVYKFNLDINTKNFINFKNTLLKYTSNLNKFNRLFILFNLEYKTISSYFYIISNIIDKNTLSSFFSGNFDKFKYSQILNNRISNLILHFNYYKDLLKTNLYNRFFVFTNSNILKRMIEFRASIWSNKENITLCSILYKNYKTKYLGNVYNLKDILNYKITKNFINNGELNFFFRVYEKKFLKSINGITAKFLPITSFELNSIVLNNYGLFKQSNFNVKWPFFDKMFIYFNKKIKRYFSSSINEEKNLIILHTFKFYNIKNLKNFIMCGLESYLKVGGSGWNVFGEFYRSSGFSIRSNINPDLNLNNFYKIKSSVKLMDYNLIN